MATTVGVVAVGAALFEVALVPGIVLGAAALFAPEFASRRLPKLQHGLKSLLHWPPEHAKDRVSAPSLLPPAAAAVLPRIQAGQALAKTVTFRVTVAALDFTWTYVLLGEIGTAAGLSALNLVAGPVFYFLHEAVWNFYDPPQAGGVVAMRGVKVTRSVAKTIVYETLGTVAEFTVNFVVVGDAATAAILTAPFAILGPFIYLGHEKAWDAFTKRARQALPSPTP
jgi:uncharacterized membrane protein